MRKLNEMYHIDADLRLIKTSNGEKVPLDEPLFIIRGRDVLAVSALSHYILQSHHTGVPQDRIDALNDVLRSFTLYRAAYPERIKLPGCTHGK